MHITALVENTAVRDELGSEHGLSLYIETDNHKILFDSGAADTFAKNAALLGVDLSAVDIAFLSHAHYDHGGGLKTFLSLNGSAKVYVGETAFDGYYANEIKAGEQTARRRYIGLEPALLKATVSFSSAIN
jgi:7,8-dihydropterin-6-yl-methyl-4-(beta-D-ribofuranosyl)aminobenzene 5'-phosphate synthase